MLPSRAANPLWLYLLWRHLLGPVHAHEAVHLAGLNELRLRSVPDVLVSLRSLELLEAVDVLARVGRMERERVARPPECMGLQPECVGVAAWARAVTGRSSVVAVVAAHPAAPWRLS